MSQILELRLEDRQMARLSRLAEGAGRTPAEASAMLVEEGLRRAEFPYIDFRDSPVGRQAYVRGSSLAVWEVVWVAREYGMNVAQTAAHLRWPAWRVQAALDYAAAYPGEIERAVEENDAVDFAALAAKLPHAEAFVADDPEASPAPRKGEN